MSLTKRMLENQYDWQVAFDISDPETEDYYYRSLTYNEALINLYGSDVSLIARANADLRAAQFADFADWQATAGASPLRLEFDMQLHAILGSRGFNSLMDQIGEK